MTDIKPQDLEALLETFDNAEWQELRLKIEGLEVFLSKTPAAGGSATSPIGRHAADPASFAPMHATAPCAAPHAVSPGSSGGEAKPAVPDAPEHWVSVRAPNLRTFYRAPQPGAPPYVSVGPAGETGTGGCLIVMMKPF